MCTKTLLRQSANLFERLASLIHDFGSNRLISSSCRAPVEEVSEALHRRKGSDLRSARDLEGRSSPMEGPHLRHRPPYARRSPGRREPYRQSQAAPAAALPPSKRWSSYIQNRSNLEPLSALKRHRRP